MSARFVLSAIGVTLAGLALTGCVDDRRVYDRPGIIAVDRDRDYGRYRRYDRDDRYDRYEPEDRRGYRRYDYRDYAGAQRRAERDEFCRQYPAASRCLGRRY